MIGMRIKYIEESPNKRTIIFKDKSEWIDFYSKTFNEMVDEFGFESYQKEWSYQKFKIKKDGERARYNDGSSLNTKSAREKQAIGWKKYTDKIKERNNIVRKNRKQIIEEVNVFLKDRGYFFNSRSDGSYTLKYNETK